MRYCTLILFLLSSLLHAEPERYYHQVPANEDSGPFIPAFASGPIGSNTKKKKTALLVFHGRGYESSYTYDTIYKRLGDLGLEERIYLMAPQFFSRERGIENPWIPGLLVWSNEWWRFGSISSGYLGPDARLVRADISSFAVIDKIIADLKKWNADTLKNLVLFGFSAGGQLVQRYSVYGKGDEAGSRDVRIIYVVASPASFMYVNPCRIGRSETSLDATKVQPTSSPKHFDDFPYGLSNIDGLDDQGATICRYFFDARSTRNEIIQRFSQREVHYFVGDRDLTQGGFDATPPAMAQGVSRLERAKNFYKNLQNKYGINLKHRLHIVEGADHDVQKIVQSEAWGRLISEIQDSKSNRP